MRFHILNALKVLQKDVEVSKIPEMHGESVPLCGEVHPTCEIQHEVCTRFSVKIVVVVVAVAAGVVSVYATLLL